MMYSFSFNVEASVGGGVGCTVVVIFVVVVVCFSVVTAGSDTLTGSTLPETTVLPLGCASVETGCDTAPVVPVVTAAVVDCGFASVVVVVGGTVVVKIPAAV